MPKTNYNLSDLEVNISIIKDAILLSRFSLNELLEKIQISNAEYEYMLANSDIRAYDTTIFILTGLGYISGYWYKLPTKVTLMAGEHLWKIDSIEKVKAATRLLLLLSGASSKTALSPDMQYNTAVCQNSSSRYEDWWLGDWRMTVAYCFKVKAWATATRHGQEFPYIMVRTQKNEASATNKITDKSILYIDIDRELYSKFNLLLNLYKSTFEAVIYYDKNAEYNVAELKYIESVAKKNTDNLTARFDSSSPFEIVSEDTETNKVAEKKTIFNCKSIFCVGKNSFSSSKQSLFEIAQSVVGLKMLELLERYSDTALINRIYFPNSQHKFLHSILPQKTITQKEKVVFKNIILDGDSDKKSPAMPALLALNDVKLKLVDSPEESVFTTLEAEFPWFLDIIQYMRLNANLTRIGHGHFYMRPLIIAGPPGNGKTSLARRFAELIGTPSLFLPLAGISDAQGLKGSNRTWGSARASNITDLLIRNKVANPLVILDEVDKINTSRHNGNASDALLQLLEPSSSAAYFDEFVATPADFSSINYILTANHMSLVFAPLVNRCTVIETEPLTPEQRRFAFSQTLRNVAKYYGITEVPPIDESVVDVVISNSYDLRGLERAAEICLTTALA